MDQLCNGIGLTRRRILTAALLDFLSLAEREQIDLCKGVAQRYNLVSAPTAGQESLGQKAEKALKPRAKRGRKR